MSDDVATLAAEVRQLRARLGFEQARHASVERELKQQSDDLLAALEMIEHACAPGDDGYHEIAWDIARAAIARATEAQR